MTLTPVRIILNVLLQTFYKNYHFLDKTHKELMYNKNRKHKTLA